MRSLDSILDHRKAVHDLPDGPGSDSSPADKGTEATAIETKPEPSATPEPERVGAEDRGAKPTPAAKAEPKPKQQTQTQAQHDDDDHEDEPADLDGFKRALTAARGDKRKFRKQWRETERKLAQLEGQISVWQRQAQQPAPHAQQPAQAAPKEDPESSFFANPVGFIDQQWSTREQKLREEWSKRENDRVQREINRSVARVRKQHEDFNAAESAFAMAAEKNPSLIEQMITAEEPAEFAYQTGKLFLEAEETGGDIDALVERRAERRLAQKLEEERAKIRAEIEAEQSGHRPATPATKPTPQRTIAGARGNGASMTPTWSGPRPLDDILPRQ